MLAYAPRPGRQTARPRTLMLIVAGHVAAIGAVMLARSDIVTRPPDPPLVFTPIEIPTEPKPVDRVVRRSEPVQRQPVFTEPLVDLTQPTFDPVPLTTTADAGPIGGTGAGSGTAVADSTPAPHVVVRRDPAMLTAGEALRPPYPETKRMLAEEAVLTLKLSIDASGRVVAVEPIGRAEPMFLASARKHLLRVWRFTPASEDGAAVPSTKVITLRFELDEG